MLSKDRPHILLINPWIHDFAAYDFWAKPLGLLQLASILNNHDIKVSYVDCLDRFHPRMSTTADDKRHGRGPYLKTRISRPPVLKDVPRHFSRYGIPVEWFRDDLSNLLEPDMVMITSLMTYWYPGVQETIRNVRDFFPTTRIVLGGIYASLCQKHAMENSGADLVVPGVGEDQLLELVTDITGTSISSRLNPRDLDSYPYPAFELQNYIPYIPILTSRGCPYDCTYCASRYLVPKCRRRNPEAVLKEIQYWHQRHGVIDFAFYDDALLMDAQNHIVPILEGVIAAGLQVRFHTPNAMHVREVDADLARLMASAGFETIRLGVETAAFDDRSHLDRKINQKDFLECIRAFKTAGFSNQQIGAYILVGLPGQPTNDVVETIGVVKKAGAKPIMAYYSPIPHTALWEEAVASSRYDLAGDPIFTNNAILPCQAEPFSWEKLTDLKNLIAS